MNEIYEAAVKYAKRGWSVFPVRKNKTPYTPNGFHNATTNLDTITRWWKEYPDANVGIATGSMSHGLTVIDIDIDESKGIHGDESFQDWCDEEGVFIDSLTAVTGRGGKHLYFTSTYPYGNKTGCLPGVDIRGEGGYVIAPPSIHENGNPYYFDGDEDEEEIVCVQEDSDVEYFFNEMCKGTIGDKAPLQIPKEVNEGSRNDMLFKIASSLQAKGAEDDVILATLQGYNETRCNPSLPDDELLKIVQSVTSKYEKGTPKTQENTQKTFRKLKTAEDLMQRDVPDPKVFVGVGDELPLLVEGTCILSAKPKLGKSWFALAMCLAVAKGEDFLGYKTNQCSTLYLDLETSESIQKKRLTKVLKGEKVPRNFYLETETDAIEDGFLEQIESYLEEDPEIGVVVVDVFQIIRSPAKSFKESEYAHAYRDITPLNELAQKHHISIILVCHDRKAVDPEDPFSNILGSTGLQGAATQMVVMFKKKKDDPIHISVKGKTIDGLPDLDVELKDAQWMKVEKGSSEARENAANQLEYMSSDIRLAVLKMATQDGGWKGRCSELKQQATEQYRIPIIDTNIRIGTFLRKHQARFLKEDNVLMEIISNGTGGSTYKFTVCNVDTVDGIVDETDAKWERASNNEGLEVPFI